MVFINVKVKIVVSSSVMFCICVWCVGLFGVVRIGGRVVLFGWFILIFLWLFMFV